MRALLSRLILSSTVTLVASLHAAEDDSLIPMFNGHDLSGWTNVNCAPETFTVRDGMIVSTGIPTGVLRTTRMYENFVVELEWRHMKAGGNAGFFIFSAPITAMGQPFTKALEIQIIDQDHSQGLATRHGDVFSIHGATFLPDRPHPQGWMRSLPSEKRVKPQGEWNHYRVESRDGVVTLAVNGKVVSGGSNCIPRKGYICLESEGSECHFRNVHIKELPSSNPPANQVAEKDEGWISLYNGLDLRGWKEVGRETRWKAKDWILECAGANGAVDKILWTDRRWSHFELIVDWRLNAEATATDQKASVPSIRLGQSIQIPLDSPKRVGQWHRCRVSVGKARMTVHVNDQLISDQPAPSSTELPIGLQPGGSRIEFANLYVRHL